MTKDSKKIEKVVVSCWAGDVRLARICVASIRYWYPKIPISLLKDESKYTFSTADIEKKWNVEIYDNQTEFRCGFWNYLAPFVNPRGKRILLMDADTVIVGRVLSELETSTADMVLSAENYKPNWKSEDLLNTYYKPDEIAKFDKDFHPAEYIFNSGQLVFTEGIIEPSEFKKVLNVENRSISKKYPEAFPLNDQSILNYLIHRKEQDKTLSVDKSHFMYWPLKEDRQIKLEDIRNKKITQPCVIHWAGLCPLKYISKMTHTDVLRFYEDYYYSRIDYAKYRKLIHLGQLHFRNISKLKTKIPKLLLNKVLRRFKSK